MSLGVWSQAYYPHYAFYIGDWTPLDPLFCTTDRPKTRQPTENILCISRVKIKFYGPDMHCTYTGRQIKGHQSSTTKTLLTTDISKSVCGCNHQRYISVFQHCSITYLNNRNIWKLYWTEMWTVTQGDSFSIRPKKMRISQRLLIRFWTCIYDNIQGVPGGMCQTSGECSLC
jgi:hypothetical protein